MKNYLIKHEEIVISVNMSCFLYINYDVPLSVCQAWDFFTYMSRDSVLSGQELVCLSLRCYKNNVIHTCINANVYAFFF